MLNLPKVGETWIDTYSGVEGIAAWVDGTTVTFVSLTGVRAAVSFNRQHITWQLKRAAPECWQQCSRQGCGDRAFLRYARPRQEEPEVVCPNHAPRGVQSQVLTQTTPADSFQGAFCWNIKSCSGVPANEILNVVLPPSTTFWLCPRCGTYCVHAVRATVQPLLSIKDVMPDGYIYENHTQVTVGAYRTLYRVAYRTLYRVTVVPKPFTQITGPKPLTLYDHLRLTGDE